MLQLNQKKFYFLLGISFYWACLFLLFNTIELVPNFGLDHNNFLSYKSSDFAINNIDLHTTMLIHSLWEVNGSYTLIPCILLGCYLSAVSYLKNDLREHLFLTVLLFPLLAQSLYISKEMLVFMALSPIPFMSYYNRYRLVNIYTFLVVGLLTLYLRKYYLIPLLIFSLLKIMPVRRLVLFVVVTNFAIWLVIPQSFEHIVSTYHSMCREGGRSVYFFFNNISGFGDFILMYIVNCFQSLFPMLYSYNVNEVFVQLYVIIALHILHKLLKSPTEKDRALWYISFFLTINLFTCQYGNLIRYLGCLAPLIIVLPKKNTNSIAKAS